MGNNGVPERRLRVVLVVDDFEYGGAQRQVVELANNLDRGRFDVHVCSLSNYIPMASALRDRRHCLHIVPRNARWDVTVVLRLAWLLRKLRADIVHGYLFSADITSRLAGRLAGTPVVVGSQRTTSDFSRRSLVAYRMTGRCVDLIVANSKAGAKVARPVHDGGPRRFRIVYNGVDTCRFAPQDGKAVRTELGMADGERVVGVFASFKPKKNHALFYAAAARVLKRIANLRLMMVGDELHGGNRESGEYKRRMAGLVDRLGIRDRCLFLGNRDDVSRLYCACDVTVLPSVAEGTPNVLLESMACGVPVVATDVADNACIVPDGQVGYVVPLGDAAAMADRILRLLENDHLRGNLARQARRWVVEEFSTARLAARTQAAYLDCLASKGIHRAGA